jgi:hypothetical protein
MEDLTLPLSSAELRQKLSLPSLTEHARRAGDPLFSFSVPGDSTIGKWRDLRKSAPPLGYWPVVFGEPENLERITELFDSEHISSTAEILAQAAALDVQEYFKQRAKELSGEHAHGPWPASIQPLSEFSLPRPVLSSEEFHPTVDIGLVPVAHCWDVPAYLSIGGWNDCPYAPKQVAVHHYWNQVYGAEIVGYSGDVIEMRVARRPASREDALKLAYEHYLYCYDIVDQGVQTIENLAATLLASDIWYFWWD